MKKTKTIDDFGFYGEYGLCSNSIAMPELISWKTKITVVRVAREGAMAEN